MSTTNVLVLCGVPLEDLSPSEDGWFYSDFLLLNTVFAGAPKSRDRWYTSGDPNKMLAHHDVSEYLHGNPYLDRKVVLRKDVNKTKNVVVKPQSELKAAFLSDLKKTAASASAAGEPLLVVFIGHGENRKSNFGFHVGTETKPSYIYQDDIHAIIKPFPKLSVTTILTSCYSGGWFSTEMTVMTAASVNRMSLSHPRRSGSGPRHCGGIYTSLLVSRLAKDAGMSSDDRNYEQWTTDTKALLAYMDRKPAEYGIRFSAQNEEWTNHWMEMVKLSITEIQARLAELPVHVSTADSFHFDRSSNEMKADLGRPETSLLFGENQGYGSVVKRSLDCRTGGGSKNALRNIVRGEARTYLDSNPGIPNAAHNMRAHDNAELCLSDEPMSLEKMQTVLSILLYRNQANDSAKTLLEIMQVDPICPYENFTTDDYITLDEEREESPEDLANPILMLWQADLISDPDSTEGISYPKPYEYVAASLMKSGIKSKEDIEARVALVVSAREKAVEQKRGTLRLTLAPITKGSRVDWIGSMSRFVNRSFNLTMKKAEDTIRGVSPEKITGLLRRMSIDTKKTGHRSRRSTDQGGSGDHHELPFQRQ